MGVGKLASHGQGGDHGPIGDEESIGSGSAVGRKGSERRIQRRNLHQGIITWVNVYLTGPTVGLWSLLI